MCDKDFNKILFRERVISNYNLDVCIDDVMVRTYCQQLFFLFLPYIHNLLYHLDHKDKQSEAIMVA